MVNAWSLLAEELEKMSDLRSKYHEDQILEDIKEYVSRTYNGHYT